MIKFFMDMIPPTTTAQEKQVNVVKGKPIFYDPPEVNRAKSKLLAHLTEYAPSSPYSVPVRLTVWWCFPVKGKHKNGEYKASRPDTDNLNKMLKDCMTVCGFWKDDALVASEIIEKFWAERPGIFIKIEELA